tara:strand:- start:54 stop:854 length:801 start_codon:yes stop_codon:yes gene_type:complete
MNIYSDEDHPLRPHFRYRPEQWGSPVAEITFPLPQWVRIGLIEYILKKNFTNNGDQHSDKKQDQYSSLHFYNMLCDVDKYEEIAKFKEYITEVIRYYCADAWSISDVEDIDIQAKSFGNLQLYGERTYPHYHNSFDGVMVTYLTVGDEFDVDLNSNTLLVNLKHNVVRKDYKELPKTLWSRTAKKTHNEEFEKHGNLLLHDPRGSINYPYNCKAISIKPESGMNILHPAYIWHESNTFLGKGIRVVIGTNFKITGGNKSPDPLVIL